MSCEFAERSSVLLQGLVIFLFSEGGSIKSPQEAADYQNVLICGEMLIAAFANLYAFPYKDYAEANVGGTETNAWQLACSMWSILLMWFMTQCIR